MAESIFKSGRKKGFVVLYRDAAQDTRLSLESRGLFALMLSLPEDWEYTVSGLAVKAGCGREKVRRLLKELQTVGYLTGSSPTGSAANSAVMCMCFRMKLHRCPKTRPTVIHKKSRCPKIPSTVKPVNGKHRQRVFRHNRI